ncbi:MAG: flagellar basal body L-ring protein FlgH [Gemmatimonadaceae bacterium]|jgi:flagellar L-ring protein precursor FlgH|nr:flagellar basal body L-ring protein FlgH [Gemmatimonadaceae bacterium]
MSRALEHTLRFAVSLCLAALAAHLLPAQPPAPNTPAAGATPAASNTQATPTAATTASTVANAPGGMRPRASWVADRRAFAVGDIVTVLIDDYTIATAVKDNIALDTRRRNVGGTVRLPGNSQGGGLQTNNDADTRQQGQARRENRFQNEMSVRIVALGANGLMQIKGVKSINVDKGMQDITLTGWVRAQDVSPQNLVESYRIADAQLTYLSPGPLGKPKSGLLTKLISPLFP